MSVLIRFHRNVKIFSAPLPLPLHLGVRVSNQTLHYEDKNTHLDSHVRMLKILMTHTYIHLFSTDPISTLFLNYYSALSRPRIQNRVPIF